MAPHIPVKMAGGRALPGYARSASGASNAGSIYRFGYPSPWPTTPHMMAREGDYPFTFNIPMSSPMDVDEVASPSPRQQDGINDANNAGQTGLNTPAQTQELLYGAVSISNRGSFLFTPTQRMNCWLDAQNASGSAATSTSQAFVTAQSHLSTVQESEPARHATPLPPTYEQVNKLAGTKHGMDDSETGETQSKRSRLSENVRRRLSRASEQSSGMASRLASAIPSPAVDVLSSLSFFSLGAGTNQAAERTIKICLVGDCGSGKTTFINRILSDEYVPGEPSAVADYRVVTTVGVNDVVKVQLWDFPGTMMGQKQSQLMTSFFDAAIVCYSIDDGAKMASVATKWKPKLDHSLAVHRRPIFVLGMKKDLRLDFPTLGLSFLNEDDNDVASQRDGKAVARSVGASGFGECSARTGENVAPVFKAIVNFVVNYVKENERKMQQSKREEKINDAVRDTKRGFKKVGKAISKLTSKFRK